VVTANSWPVTRNTSWAAWTTYRWLERSIALAAGSKEAHLLLSNLTQLGPFYLGILRRIHERFRPRTYFEVGVLRGESMCLVSSETFVIGVDPEPAIARPIGERTTTHLATGDEYFE
jgi:hypothetical protein